MFFSTHKHKEIRKKLEAEGKKEKTTNIAKQVAAEWKAMTPEERKPWDDIAADDRARFEMERSTYTGPWKIPSKRKGRKDKNAPKRPMSAFLAYSHTKRAECRAANPDLDNIGISRELAKMWKIVPQEEKQPFIDEEARLRKQYKIEIAEWRAKNVQTELAAQEQREAAATMRLENPPPTRQYDNDLLATLSASLPRDSIEGPYNASAPNNLAAVAAGLAARSSDYPSATSSYGQGVFSSSAANPSYGSNDDILSRVSASAALAAYAQEREQQAALVRAIANSYSNPLNGVYTRTTAEQNPYLSAASTGAYAAAAAAPAYGAVAGLPSAYAPSYASSYASAPSSSYYGSMPTNERYTGYTPTVADYASAYRQQQEEENGRGGYLPRSPYM
jgi:hypothetical protein